MTGLPMPRPVLENFMLISARKKAWPPTESTDRTSPGTLTEVQPTPFQCTRTVHRDWPVIVHGWLVTPQTLAGLSTASSPINHPSGSRLLVHLLPLKISAYGLSDIGPSL